MISLINKCQSSLNNIKNIINPQKIQISLDSISNQLQSQFSPQLSKEFQKLSNSLNSFNSLSNQLSYLSDLYKEFPNDPDPIFIDLSNLYNQIYKFEFSLTMSKPDYNLPAILSINAGAGGLEASNWVSILERMYLRWASQNNFEIELLDQKLSDENPSICTDSVSYKFTGPFAYGLLKFESGVHRLIRNSPFNSNLNRHTSFAAVSVSPDVDDEIDVIINPKDIEISAQTSSGKGGQNVNKVASAIRLKHLPTGINILVRSQRDQLQNKKIALKMLKSKLYDIQLKKLSEEQNKILSQQSQISFGSQIRTYTLSPYQLIKDHRSDFSSNNSQSFLDGNINELLFLNCQRLS